MTEPHVEMFSLPPLEDTEYWERNIAAGLHQPMSAEERAEIMAELDAERDLFDGLSHAQVLEMEFPEERMLVEDVVPIGAVGTIAGVPETYKSWQAQTIAVAVATGQGGIFGRPVLSQGSVGYFWQDDSTREEAERIKLFDSTRGDGTDIPVRWYLNEGLRLPEHLQRLKHTIVHNDHKLVVLDSFYNVLFGTNLKDEEAEQVITLLKSEICDATDCTILIVDHMPWATPDNRKRLRAYGGVFKGAAIRFGIYLDAVGDKIYAECRGNNITGFKRQLAAWDPDTLELTLVQTSDAVTDEEYEQRIIDYLEDHPDAPTDQLKSPNITGSHNDLVAARTRLLAQNRLVRRRERTNAGPYLWKLSIHAENTGTDTQSYQPVLDEWYGGTAGTPLRGEYQAVPPTSTEGDDDLDKEIPF